MKYRDTLSQLAPVAWKPKGHPFELENGYTLPIFPALVPFSPFFPYFALIASRNLPCPDTDHRNSTNTTACTYSCSNLAQNTNLFLHFKP